MTAWGNKTLLAQFANRKYNADQIEAMNLWERIQLKLRGFAYIGTYSEEGWSGALPHYALKCEIHGIVVTHPEGFRQLLRCPKCLAELVWEDLI